MKNNISDSLLEKTIEKMNELNEEALKELGLCNDKMYCLGVTVNFVGKRVYKFA